MSKRSTPSAGSPENVAAEGVNPNPSDDSDTIVGSQPTADVSALANTLIEEAPAPQQHAIDQASAERAQSAEDSKDAAGVAFDETQHTGTKTTAGLWRKKSGRKPAASGPRAKLNIPGSAASSAEPAGIPGPDAKIAEARATGVVAANLFLMFAVATGGEEWQPRNENEKPMLEQGFAAYFESQQWTDLPPWLGLCACIGMYALPRFAMPKTKERAKGFRNWVAGKYISWKANRARKAYERKYGPSPIERADRDSRTRFAEETTAMHKEVAPV